MEAQSNSGRKDTSWSLSQTNIDSLSLRWWLYIHQGSQTPSDRLLCKLLPVITILTCKLAISP